MPPTERPPSTTVFAKTTRPEIANVIARERLFEQLDGASSRTVAWIAGPAGSGKSTLAASYVAARNYRAAWVQVDRDDEDVEAFFHFLGHAARRIGVAAQRLPAFDADARRDPASYARSFFRRLFADAGSGAAIVIDNLELGDDDSTLRCCIENGLTQVPRHCAVLVTCRQDPPQGLARLRVGGDMVYVGADSLRVGADELQALAQQRGHPLTERDAQRLLEHTQGWAAAIVLMLEHAKMTGGFAEAPRDAAPAVLFDYLAGEIFARFDPAAREMLLRIACLPRMSVDVAVAMTGDDRVARLLLNLSQNDYFVRELVGEDRRLYVLHPLHREFLLRQAQRELPLALAPDAIARGARLLCDAGLHEDAVPMLVQAHDWSTVADIVVEHADALLAQGRRATLLGWLEQLPPTRVESDPSLLRIDAASRLGDSPRASRQRFEQAWRLSRDRGDLPGRLLAGAGVVEAIVAEFDDLAALEAWSAELGTLLDAPTTEPAHGAARTTSMIALWLREPGHDRVLRWCAEVAARSDGADARADPRATMLCRIAALLRGDLALAETIALASPVADDAGSAGAALLDALHRWIDGDADAAWRALDGLDAAAPASGVNAAWRALLRAAVALARADVAACALALEQLAGRTLRRGDRALLQLLRSGLAGARHDTALAVREARGALHVAIELGLPWIEAMARLALAQALAAAGDRGAAQAQCVGVAALATRLDSPPLACSERLLRARLLFDQGEDDAAEPALRDALVALRKLGARQVIGVSPGMLASVLADALRLSIEVDPVRQLVRQLGLRAPPQAQRLRDWPRRFELCTLGGFELLRDGRALEWSAKGPGRPLELLKLLLAYGGRHVRVDELSDAMWPHVDGDYAYKSFTATLHRLRRLLGDDDAVPLREGRLGLDPTLFWVDTWAFDQLVGEVDAARDAQASPATVRALAVELVALYRGPFLPDEGEHPSYLARRDQLRTRLLRVLAQAWNADDGGAADPREIDARLRCIQVDELHEPFHRELMLAWQRRGDAARAAAAFEHLNTLLATRLRTRPCAETLAVLRPPPAPAASSR